MGDEVRQAIEQLSGDECLFAGILNVKGAKKPEQKLLALSPYAIITLSYPKVKILTQTHFLDIKEVKSASPNEINVAFKTNAPAVVGEVEAADDFILTLLTSVKQSFPGLAEPLFKVEVAPDSRMPEIPEKEISCGGFISSYLSVCKYLDVPARDDICWDMEHLVTVQKLDKLNLNEFENPSPSDVKAMLYALKYNNYFKGLEAPDFPLGRDKAQIDALFECLKANNKIETLDLSNTGLKSEHIVTLSGVLLGNKNLHLTDLNLSGNAIEATGLTPLCKYLETAPHGIVSLNLEGCSINSKGFQALGNALKKNMKMPTALTYLNLSHNKIEPEGSMGLSAFISNPNNIRTLQIKETAANLETLSNAIVRGCPELRVLDLAGNKITPKVIPHLTKWIGSSSQLEVLNLSNTAIPADGFKEILLAIAQNVYLKTVTVKAKSNGLGGAGASAIAGVAPTLKNIQSLDLGDNDFGDDGIVAICDGFHESEALKILNLDANLSAKSKKGNSHSFDALISLIDSSCPLEALSICGSKTMQPKTDDLLAFIYAVGVNDSLLELNVSGNAMGNKGAVAIGKALQTNKTLKTLIWDDNGTTFPGFVAFKVGLERNRTLKNMPMPILDIAACMKETQGRALNKLQKLVTDIEACVYRNQNPSSRFEASKGYQMGSLMLNMGQQNVVDSELLKIKRSDPTKQCDKEENRRIMEDAAKTEKVMTSFQLLKEQMQADLEVELRQKLKGFAAEATELVLHVKQRLKRKMLHALKKTFESFDADATWGPLKTAIDYGAKEFDNTTLEQILVQAAGSEIMNKASDCYASSVELASDYVYEKVMDSLEDLLEDVMHAAQEEEEARIEAEAQKEAEAAPQPAPTAKTPEPKEIDKKKPETPAPKPEPQKIQSNLQILDIVTFLVEAPAPEKKSGPDTLSAAPPRSVAVMGRGRPMPGRLAQNAALAAVIARGPGAAPPPRRTPAEGAPPAEPEPAQASSADAQKKPAQPTATPTKPGTPTPAPRKIKPGVAKDSVLSQAASHEPAGPALQHITKSRPKVAGRAGTKKGGKPTRRPPTRRARPVNRSADEPK